MAVADDLTVELWIDGAWVDVTSYVFSRQGDRIAIERGASNEAPTVEPSELSLTFYDPDRVGRWSNRQPSSPFYRKLTRNVPIRVRYGSTVRCVMEVPVWEPRWDLSQRVLYTPITAYGILRRLNQGTKALRSPLERGILTETPVAHWSLLDGTESTQAASSLPTGQPMSMTGTVTFGTVAGLFGEGMHPQLVDSAGAYPGQLHGPVSYVETGLWQIDAWVLAEAHSSGVNDQMNILGFDVIGSNKFMRGELNLVHDNGIGDTQINVYFYDTSGNVVTYLADAGYQVVDGQWHLITIRMVQSSASIMDMYLYADGVIVNQVVGAVSGTIGRIAEVYTPGRVVDGAVNSFSSMSIGYLGVYDNLSSPTDRYLFGTGYLGETAGRRIERLCAQEGVAFSNYGNLDETAPMGPQKVGTLIDLLEGCAAADRGLLREARSWLGLIYHPRSARMNQAGPEIPYGMLTQPFDPSEDDQHIWNDVTVERVDGSSARSVLDHAPIDADHTLSTLAPPDGVGTYDRGALRLNVATDDQLQPIADWLRHLGTWDELRYPALTIPLVAPAWTADAALTAQMDELDVGEQLSLVDLPAWLPETTTSLHVQHVREVFTPTTREMELVVSAGRPWEAWALDTGTSTLTAPVSASGTTIRLAQGTGPAWNTTREPYHIQAAGNAMTVTSMVNDTPAFIAAGAVAHGNNASVTPGLPAGITPDVGQVILGWAAIRNSGVGTVNLPAGWTEIARVGNVLFFGRYYLTGVVAPLISFTGGVLNADTSARLFAWSGLSLNRDDGKYRRTDVSPQTLLNASAQNINWPGLSIRRDGCVAFLLAWKQDDATSVALPAGFDAEIMDDAATLGDDQHLAAYYDIQATATDVAAGTLVVTGGVAAISRAVTVALRPTQTATVTRDVNGVSTAIAAGEAVHTWRSGVLGL